jgi:prepilin-type N-terminal cleavage/methylation domain-containing protein
MKYVFQKKQTRGFTLLETLVAIAILSMAVGAAFSIASKSLISSFYSRNQTTALFLAAEGLELVRNVRDNVAIYNQTHSGTDKNWLEPFIAGCISPTSSCDINPTAFSTAYNNAGSLEFSALVKTGCGTYGCVLKNIYLVPGDVQAYSSTGSTGDSFYSRKITIVCIPSDCDDTGKIEAYVTSTVFWNRNADSISITETLSNWN